MAQAQEYIAIPNKAILTFKISKVQIKEKQRRAIVRVPKEREREVFKDDNKIYKKN